MKIDGRLLLALIIALELIPGAYAVELSGGISASSKDNGFAEGNIVVDNSGMTFTTLSDNSIIDKNIQAALDTVPLDYGASVTDKNGKHAEVTAHIEGGTFSEHGELAFPKEGKLKTKETTVSAIQTLTAQDVGIINTKAQAWNKAGDTASVGISVSHGSIIGYDGRASATESLATAAQYARAISGSTIDIDSNAQRGNLAGAGVTSHIENGEITEYYSNAEASEKAFPLTYTMDSSQGFLSASGKSLYFSGNAYKNKEGRISAMDYSASTSLTIAGDTSDGLVNGYSNTATTEYLKRDIANLNNAISSQEIQSAHGNFVDIKSNAENSRTAYEYVSDWDGKVKPYTPAHGGAKFEFKTNSLGCTNIGSKASPSNVEITPLTLPEGTKKAIMLEPFYTTMVGISKQTDLGTTVFPTLVGKEYAVSWYTDSGASSDKFNKLGDNDIVLIHSHMTPSAIGLSTSKNALLTSNLIDYKTSKKSFVLLAGCSGLGGYPQPSELAKAFSSAYLIGGYDDRVNGRWDSAYVSELFTNMGDGNKDVFNSNAMTLAKLQSDPNFGTKGRLPLRFLPIDELGVPTHTDFKLSADYMVRVGQLIQDYIDRAMSGDTITISPGIFNENLRIDKSITLKGAGSSESGTIVDGKGSGSVIAIGKVDPNINVNLYNMLIRNGLSSAGGGIYNLGTLNVEDCTITDNRATYGGGVYNTGGSFTMKSGTISGNIAEEYGGGVFNNHGTLTMNSGTITGNTAAEYGGGIYNLGALTVEDSTISGNTATNGGGGVYNDKSAIADFVDSTISGNSFEANNDNFGGGVYNIGSSTFTRSTISDNSACHGGGVYNGGSATFTGSKISKNYAYWYDSGAGVYNDKLAIADFVDSTISENIAYSNGGGVFNDGSATFTRSEIFGNQAFGDGGGVYNFWDGSATFVDSTISGNAARYYDYSDGGGVGNVGSATFTRCTISDNTAKNDGGGVFNEVNLGSATFVDSTISGNVAEFGNGGGICNYYGLSIAGTTQIINNQATNGYGGGIHSWLGNKFDGPNVAIKSNKAHLPDTLPAGAPWYQQYGVYMESRSPTTTNGFDPATQVTDNTKI